MAQGKRKWSVMRFRRNDPSHNLIAAVTHFVRANGGRCVVVGGIETQDYGEKFKFKVAVNCLGRKPVAKEKRKEL